MNTAEFDSLIVQKRNVFLREEARLLQLEEEEKKHLEKINECIFNINNKNRVIECKKQEMRLYIMQKL
jgi:hypothetical protein